MAVWHGCVIKGNALLWFLNHSHIIIVIRGKYNKINVLYGVNLDKNETCSDHGE